jgi:hypothetical protein
MELGDGGVRLWATCHLQIAALRSFVDIPSSPGMVSRASRIPRSTGVRPIASTPRAPKEARGNLGVLPACRLASLSACDCYPAICPRSASAPFDVGPWTRKTPFHIARRGAHPFLCFELEAFIVFLGFGIADAQTSSSELPEQEEYSIAPFAQRSQSPCWQPPQGLLQSQDRPRHGRSGAYRRLSSLVVAGSCLFLNVPAKARLSPCSSSRERLCK